MILASQVDFTTQPKNMSTTNINTNAVSSSNKIARYPTQLTISTRDLRPQFPDDESRSERSPRSLFMSKEFNDRQRRISQHKSLSMDLNSQPKCVRRVSVLGELGLSKTSESRRIRTKAQAKSAHISDAGKSVNSVESVDPWAFLCEDVDAFHIAETSPRSLEMDSFLFPTTNKHKNTNSSQRSPSWMSIMNSLGDKLRIGRDKVIG